jgi:hypothetical protein
MEFLNGCMLKNLYEKRMDILRLKTPRIKDPRDIAAEQVAKK